MSTGKPMTFTLSSLFDSSDSFDHDTASVEFATVGPDDVVRLKEIEGTVVPTTAFLALFSADGSADAEASRGDGDASLAGGPTIEDGALKLASGGETFASYDATDNADQLQQGCVRVVVQPQYTGSAPSEQRFYDAGLGGNGGVSISHNGGNIEAVIRDDVGSVLVSLSSPYSATSGTDVEVELNWNLDAGASRLFVGGSVVDSDLVTTGTRTVAPSTFRIGSRSSGETGQSFWLLSLATFNAVQHTAGYAASGAPGYFDQSSPSVTGRGSVGVTELSGFTVSGSGLSTPTDTSITYALIVDDSETYWDGSAWVDGDGTVSQSSTEAQINTNAASLDLSEGARIRVKVYLTTDAFETPTLGSVSLDGDFTLADSAPSECLVYGNLADILGESVESATVKFKRVGAVKHGTRTLLRSEASSTTDASGYFEISLVETETIDSELVLTLDYTQGGDKRFQTVRGIVIPNQASANLAALLPDYEEGL